MKKLSIIIILISALCSCCKRAYCPAFPAELNYFPYSKGQEIFFYNSQDTLTFVITRQGNSEASDFGYNSHYHCEIGSTVQMDGIYGVINFIGGETVSKIDVEFYLSNGEVLGKTLYEGNSIPYAEVGKYFNDTISIEKENNKTINKIIIVKNKGLVSYATADGEEWKLVE